MVATNTLKRQAVDNKTPLGVWLGGASCTPVSCGVPPDVEHTLHVCGAAFSKRCTLRMCLWIFIGRIAYQGGVTEGMRSPTRSP